jgi:5-enolpyruvylshikimate-3-phosphate synthase
MSKEEKENLSRSRPRPEGRAGERGAERRRQPAQSLSEEIMQLDSDLLALLGKRSVLMHKLRKGKAYASSPGIIKSEKQIRGAWEQQSGRLSGSLRLSRQLFGLINELEIQQERIEEYNPFNLSPSRQAVQVNVDAPSSTVIGQLWLALAASCARATRLTGLLRSASLLDTVRAFEQVGVHMDWKDGDLVLDGKNAPDYHGKAVFLGDDLLNFYIFVFLGVSQTGKLRFTGGPSLKEADLGVLARFLPSLGARLVSVVPGTKGLPVNVECSGELPNELVVPGDLPGEAVLAVLLAALTWRRRISVSLDKLESTLQGRIVDLAKQAFLPACGFGQVFEKSVDYNGYALSDLDFPAEIKVPIDTVMSAVLLALPVFAGGSATLNGKLINCIYTDEFIEISKNFGLEVKSDDVAVSSTL